MTAAGPTFADPVTDHLPILIRAYAEPAAKADPAAHPRRRRQAVGPSDVTLIFDTETTIDPSQRLRIGLYQLRVGGELDEEGVFYDSEALSPVEIETVEAFARDRGLPPPITLATFRQDIFLARAYDTGALIIGFNLPFDLARIALDATTARASKWRRKMHGAFTLKFSEDPRWPNVQVKHLSPRAALIEFTVPGDPQQARSKRRRGPKPPAHRGHFVDVKTLAAALTSRPHNLESLCEAMDVVTRKVRSEEHGAALTMTYLDYARADVQATWECYEALHLKLETHGLGVQPWDIHSEASIGKATFAALGIVPWREVQPDCPPWLIGQIMGAYFGGRTEVRWRLKVRRVLHTDFMSMYPTVCVLMNLWRFMIAEGFSTRDATAETRALLDAATPQDFQDQDSWRTLAVLVKVRPDGDLLPVRARYQTETHATIGLNHLTHDGGLWFTLADCLVAKFLGGKTPVIEEAIAFDPGPIQTTLRPLNLLGVHRIDPRQDDLFRALIQLREQERLNKSGKSEAEKVAIEERRQAIKITANATSYGVFVQLNVETDDQGAQVRVFGGDGEPFVTRSRKVETPGPLFHPLLATLITGAARLMLALAHHRAEAAGLDWAFCDTDSLAIAKPDGLDDAQFEHRALEVVEWFSPLNPYGSSEPILKVEDVNLDPEGSGEIRPLYCLAISSKRYALFNLDGDGRPILRKASAHGLGHLLAPYGEADAPADIPPPHPSLRSGKDRLERWQYDLWFMIVADELDGGSRGLKLDYHPALSGPTVSRYGATSPELLGWLKGYSAGRPYAERVKPFGFMYSLHRRRGQAYDDALAVSGLRDDSLHPMAPYDRDLNRAIAQAFDRLTGAPVPRDALETYAEALAGYHRRPESKFLNGEAFDVGRTEPRHVVATGIELIGKEADQWEEVFILGVQRDAMITYGASPVLSARVFIEVRQAISVFGVKPVADALKLTRSSVAKIADGEAITIKTPLPEVRCRLQLFQIRKAREHEASRRRETEAREAVARTGSIRAAARELGVDPSNLAKLLRRSRIEDE